MGQHDLHSIMKLLPNEDCSLCDAPSCATLARRIVAGKIKVDHCPLIDKRNIGRITDILKEGVETTKETTQEEAFVEIQPCAEYGRVTLEAQLPKPKGSVYDLFDSCTMCTAFSDISDLDGVRCSLELGYGLAQLEEKRIHVFRSGKVTMRRAYDRRDAYETLAMISKSLWPSVICPEGCSVQECISCSCPDCRGHVCSGVSWWVRDIPFKEQPMGEFLKEYLASTDETTAKAVAMYKDGIAIMDNLVEELKKAEQALKAGDRAALEEVRKVFHGKHMELAQLSVKILIGSEGPAAMLGLIMKGAEINMRNIGKGLFTIRQASKDPLFEKAYELALKGISVFTTVDIDGAKPLLKDFDEFVASWKERPYTSEGEFILKIASYGSFLAMMLERPIPIWTLEDERKVKPKITEMGEHC